MLSAIRKIIGIAKVKKIQLHIDDEWVICDNVKTIQKTLQNHVMTMSKLNSEPKLDDIPEVQNHVMTMSKLNSEPKLDDIPEVQNHIVKSHVPIRLVSSAISIDALPPIDINLEEPKGDIENGIVYDIYTAIVEAIDNSEILSLFHFLNDMSIAVNGL
jgi:hypothetical protein